ncbi:hypothetical protein BFW01_g8128 [Lasiodiplodia theobromae]|uniref:uncharacterized protein n=1 Tax=Lasiodiplodia theobromae TaxID=45133 RepID=UPI0015C328CD|nr:uncharacterized protein LTHEOB_12617 [Lasiodiplodia theobromae]KAF4535741.1 hypothetical protein LTHEOB_12617 [Lasiodiplodia theobromae]KAF9637232.1 hypothetical protein BFW01_g8128 [Lasiodiplodia theobromae]
MGGRQSVPRGPDGLNETSRPTRPPGSFKFNGRTMMAPLAAVTMASLLFVYTRTSIRAAKLNAQKHREADGGQISWKNEARRRHGQADQVSESSLLKEALFSKEQIKSSRDAHALSAEKPADAEALEKAKLERRG